MSDRPLAAEWAAQAEAWARWTRTPGHDHQELNADIEDWADRWNEDPKPHVWVKTGDEILDNLAGYCNTINVSRH